MITKQMTRKMAMDKLRTRWQTIQAVSSTPLTFGEWLQKSVGLEFFGWRVVRDSQGNVKLESIK